MLKTDSAVLAIASNGNSTQPHLFRTYDHISTGRPAPFLRNVGGADSAPILEVARATSAVPYYFKNATIQDKKYKDAGADLNNPSLEAFAEINAIHRPRQNDTPTEHEALALEDNTQQQNNKQSKREAEKDGDPRDAIAVFVSIGSGKRPLPRPRAAKAISGFKTLAGIHQNEAQVA